MSAPESRLMLVLGLAVVLAMSAGAHADHASDLPEDPADADEAVDGLGLPDLSEVDLSGVSETGEAVSDGAGGVAGAIGAWFAAAGAAIAGAAVATGAALAGGAAALGGALVFAGSAMADLTSTSVLNTFHGFAVLGGAAVAGAGLLASALGAAGAALGAAVAASGAAVAAALAGAVVALAGAVLAGLTWLFTHPALSHPAARAVASAGVASVPAAAAYGTWAMWARGWFDPLLQGVGRVLGKLAPLAPFAGLPLYSRIDKNSVLDNPVRERIFEYIRDHPGAHVSKISNELELGWGTTVHHLKHLERTDLVSKRKARNHTCYFENGGTYSPREQRALAALKNRKARRIANYVKERPGASQKELAQDLGLSQSLVSWHVAKLEKAGLIGRERHGKSYELLPGEELPAAVGTAE